MRLVKSFGGEPYEDARFGAASHQYSEGMVRINRVSALSQPLTEMIGMSIAVLILWIGAKDVLSNNGMDAASLIVFMTVVMQLLPPFKQLSQTPTTAQQSFAAAERLFEVLDEPTEQQLDRGTRRVTTLERAIEFRQVSFAYDDEPVLRDISFIAPRGGGRRARRARAARERARSSISFRASTSRRRAASRSTASTAATSRCRRCARSPAS